MIEKMDLHYSFTNPASVYDEEALTALELAGRQGAKINEVITDQNNLRTETENHLSAQDIDIKNQKENVIPATISSEVMKHINNGTFDMAINEYVDNLESRVDNLLGSVTQGSTSMDAEIIDARTDIDGNKFSTLGTALRTQTDSLIRPAYLRYYSYMLVDSATIIAKNGCVASVQFTPTKNSSAIGWHNTLKPNRNYTLIVETSGNIAVNRPFMTNAVGWNMAPGVEMEVSRKATRGNATYIDFLYTEGENPPAYLSIRFEGGLNESCQAKVSVIPNIIHESGRPEVKLIDEPILIPQFDTMIPTTQIKYEPGVYVVNQNYTPTMNLAAFVLWGSYDVGIPYRIRIKVNNAISFAKLWLKTVSNWSDDQGESATIIYENKQLSPTEHEVYFKVIENAANAGCLMLRFTATANTEYNVQLDMVKMFHYEFGNTGTPSTPFIAFIGDSLTANGYSSFIDSGDISKNVYAVGGEGITQIFARTGVIPWKCFNTELVSGANVLSTDCENLFLQGMGNVNPVSIAGINGVLSLDASNNVVFTPSETIETTQIYEPEIIPNIAKLRPEIYVLWAGTNNIGGWTAEQVFEHWRQFMNVHPNSLIVGLTRDTDETFRRKIATLNDLAKNEFGSRFIDIHKWLLAHALAYNGLTATSDDTSAIASGKLPPSIMADTIHFNDYGKKAVAHLVEERLKKLGVL